MLFLPAKNMIKLESYIYLQSRTNCHSLTALSQDRQLLVISQVGMNHKSYILFGAQITFNKLVIGLAHFSFIIICNSNVFSCTLFVISTQALFFCLLLFKLMQKDVLREENDFSLTPGLIVQVVQATELIVIC